MNIDEGGLLWIERAGVMKPQFCPFVGVDEGGRRKSECGHWCPLFGDPEPTSEGGTEHVLTLCYGHMLVGEITDERKGNA